SIPEDELARMQASLEPLGEAVRDFPHSDLWFNVVYHPNSRIYHVEAKLKVPGRTFFSGDTDPYLDSAYQRCVRQMVQRLTEYKDHPDGQAQEQAGRQATLDREIMAPQDPADGILGRAVAGGDYRAFRTALSGYEEWLRKRVGRWIQRYPQAEAQVGDGLLIGDLLEEVYLNAFERVPAQPTEV